MFNSAGMFREKLPYLLVILRIMGSLRRILQSKHLHQPQTQAKKIAVLKRAILMILFC
jgi:hypothetical protein